MNGFCGYCGNHHPFTECPKVKAREYYPNGTIKRVEFFDEKIEPVQDKDA